MKKYILMATVAGGMAWLATAVFAEVGRPTRRPGIMGTAQFGTSVTSRHRPQTRANKPKVSPYLNLFRAGDPALNYHNIVKPELEFRANQQNLSREVQSLEYENQEIRSRAKSDEISVSGHRTAFGDYRGYYTFQR